MRRIKMSANANRYDVHHRRDAFTLMEMLITIAVIAVLTIITLTITRSVTKAGALAKSTSNLRTISNGLNLYTNENNGQLPDSAFCANVPGDSTYLTWFNALAYYLEGPEYIAEQKYAWPERGYIPKWLQCPARPVQPNSTYKWYGQSANGVGYGWNFGQFGYQLGSGPYGLGYRSKTLQVGRPTQTIIIGTTTEIKQNGRDVGNAPFDVTLYASNQSTRFDGRGLYLFLDGHSEKLTPAEFAAKANYLYLKTKPGE